MATHNLPALKTHRSTRALNLKLTLRYPKAGPFQTQMNKIGATFNLDELEADPHRGNFSGPFLFPSRVLSTQGLFVGYTHQPKALPGEDKAGFWTLSGPRPAQKSGCTTEVGHLRDIPNDSPITEQKPITPKMGIRILTTSVVVWGSNQSIKVPCLEVCRTRSKWPAWLYRWPQPSAFLSFPGHLVPSVQF